MEQEDEGVEGSVARGSDACPEPGLYRHYKGADYRVLGCVRHSESEECLVLYRALHGERGLWVRPLEMFVGTVETDGHERPRFARIETAVADETTAGQPDARNLLDA